MGRVNGSDPGFWPIRAVCAAAALALLALFPGACAHRAVRATLERPSDADIARLWQEPSDLPLRDLFHGPGGKGLRPDPSAPYTFVSEDRSGYSRGYEVRASDGLLWSVKLGPEAQPEVVVSRVLWAIGYHQPPTYYVEAWTLGGARSGPQPPGRFRAELPDRRVAGVWSWYENDFVNTQPFKGLIVANLIVNNWDWKTTNNKIYEIERSEPLPPQRVYVVRDLGASLGRMSFPKVLDWLRLRIRGAGQGSRNDLAGFEAQGFIKTVRGGRVTFDYRGIHHGLLDTVSRRDVVWTCRLLSRLSDAQWDEAFRAAGYPDGHRRRFIAKIRQKIGEGLKLADARADASGGRSVPLPVES